LTDRFIIGLIGAPFGVKGFLKVHPCSGEIGHLLKLQSVILNKNGTEKSFKVKESSPSHPFVLMRFEGIDNPESAKTLNGSQLIAGRDQAAPLVDDEFYIEDLKALPVISVTGKMLGHITDVIEGGGGELVEIEFILNNESKEKTRENKPPAKTQLQNNKIKKLIPLRKEFFAEINIENKRIVLDNLWILE